MLAFLLPIGASCAACTTTSDAPLSDRRIATPDGYTVFWDLPETGGYWLPREIEVSRIQAVVDDCEAETNLAIYHHIPVPPQYSHFALQFLPSNDEIARRCVLERLGAVNALTPYEN